MADNGRGVAECGNVTLETCPGASSACKETSYGVGVPLCALAHDLGVVLTALHRNGCFVF